MSPLSVLRIWSLGLFSWVLLGGGIYMAKLCYDEFQKSDTSPRLASDIAMRIDDPRDPNAAGNGRTDVDAASARTSNEIGEPASLPTVDADQASDRDIVVVPDTVAVRDDTSKWWLLAGSLVCLSLSLMGRWPVSLMLGSSRTSPTIARLVPTQTQLLESPDGARLNVEIFETGGDARDVEADALRPTIILTHGWTLDRSAWDYLMPVLTRHYRVVRYDLAGLGRSMRPSDLNHTLERMSEHLNIVVDSTSKNRAVVLAGHSIGGMILQTYARVHSEKFTRHGDSGVCGLILLHTTYINPLRTMIASRLVTALEYVLVVPMNYLTIVLAPLGWLSNWQSYWNGSLHLWSRVISFSGKQTFEQLERGARLAARAWPATVARGNLAMLKLNEAQTLPTIAVPVLVVSGKHDIITKPSASDVIAKSLPRHQEFRDDGGHLGYWEQSEQVAQRMVTFVDSIRPASASTDHIALRRTS